MSKNKIIYAADKNFLEFALVSINSAIVNGNSNYDYYVLHNFEDEKHFKTVLNNYKNIEYVNLIAVDGSIFEKWKTNATLTSGAYLRLLIPNLFRSSEKVLYLDCDTLVLDKLDSIFSADVSMKSIAGVLDDKFGKNNSINGIKNYINSGVMLMNCKKLSSDNFIEKIRFIYENYEDKIIYHDQCLINFYQAGNTQLLPNKFNKMIRAGHINSGQWIKALEDLPTILHYLGPVKPWMSWSNRSVTAHWLAYANLAGFASTSIRKPSTAYEKLLLAKACENDGNHLEASEIKTEIISFLSSINSKK